MVPKLPRYSVLSMLLGVALVCISIALARSLFESYQLRRHIYTLRNRLGDFDVEDRTAVYLRELPNFTARGLRFRVYLPADRRFELVVAEQGSDVEPIAVWPHPSGRYTMILNIKNGEGESQLTISSAAVSHAVRLKCSAALPYQDWIGSPHRLDPSKPAVLLNQPCGDHRLLVVLRVRSAM